MSAPCRRLETVPPPESKERDEDPPSRTSMWGDEYDADPEDAGEDR